MNLFLHQLDLCAPLFLLVFVGWGLRKARFFTDEVGTALTGFTFRFLIPVLLFDMLSDLSKMPPVDWRVLLAFFGSCMVLFTVGKIVYPKLFKVNAAGCTILAMGGVFGNNVQLGIPILGICVRQALKSPIFCRVYSMLRRSSQDDEERITNFRAAVLKMRDLVKRQLPDAHFVVLSYDSPTEVIQRSLAETDIEIIRCSELVEKPLEHADYHIPHDGHPTGALWRDLLPGLLRILDSSRFEPGAVSGQ